MLLTQARELWSRLNNDCCVRHWDGNTWSCLSAQQHVVETHNIVLLLHIKGGGGGGGGRGEGGDREREREKEFGRFGVSEILTDTMSVLLAWAKEMWSCLNSSCILSKSGMLKRLKYLLTQEYNHVWNFYPFLFCILLLKSSCCYKTLNNSNFWWLTWLFCDIRNSHQNLIP